MKILQVIPKLGYGGAETGCFDLAHYLTENRCKSYIITSGGPLLKYIKKDKVTVIRLPVQSKNPLIMLFNAIAIFFIIWFLNISIVHARSRAPAWSCWLATKFTRSKFVTTFHGTYNFSNPFKKFYNSVMVRADLVIGGSNFIFEHVYLNYGNYFKDTKRKFLVIFRGINTDFYNPQKINQDKLEKLIDEWKVDKEKFVILLPGRLTKWKGHEVFIDALNILNQRYNIKSFIAIILGNDQGRKVYSKKLESLAERYRLNNNLIFIPKCEEMPLAYEMANVVVSSSIEPEAFGRISVESQSMQKTIIASNIGGSKETIINEKTGFLVEAGNSNALAEKLIEIMNLDSWTLQSIGIEGRKNVLKKFDIDRMCFTTFSEYKKLLE
jgi:glycosyltransferase involved in cell wall biosynthesis|tara:strand:- start:716 stop:1861 length:1146 start_codon:yes stop_codon:yes gene_type:complete